MLNNIILLLFKELFMVLESSDEGGKEAGRGSCILVNWIVVPLNRRKGLHVGLKRFLVPLFTQKQRKMWLKRVNSYYEQNWLLNRKVVG